MINVTINGIDYVPRVDMPRFDGERSGAYLRRMRLRRGWSMAQVADACETTQSAIHEIETAKHKPSVAVLAALAGLYNVTLDAIVRGDAK